MGYNDNEFSVRQPSAPRGTRSSVGVVLAVVGITAALCVPRLTPYHPWGDDFAGYLLQARALQTGSAAAEVELNRELTYAGDRRLGPDAYPWGTPLLLAAAASVVGWDVNQLKVVGIACLLVLAILVPLLYLQLGLSALATLALAAVVLWQPSVLSEVDQIGSDLPFLVLCVAHLNVIMALLRRHRDSGVLPYGWLLAAGAIAAISFAVRSNGAVLIGATIVAAMYCLARTPGRTAKQNIRAALLLSVSGVAVLASFLVLLPDGTQMHFMYLTVEPASLVRRALEITRDLTLFVPVQVLPDMVDDYVVLALLPLAALGAVAMGGEGLVLASTVGAHLLLLLVFPKGDGLRYYYPALPPFVLLCWFGASSAAAWAAERAYLPGRQYWHQYGRWSPALLAAVVLGITASSPSSSDEALERGPMGGDFRELVGEVRRLVPSDARVSFFRPRALRWFSDRQAVAVVEPISLSGVDGVALFHRLDPAVDLYKQPTEADVVATGQFLLAFRNRDFSLYLRSQSAAR